MRIQSHALHLDGWPIIFALGLLGDKPDQMELKVCQMVQWRLLTVQNRVKKHSWHEVIFIEQRLVTDHGSIIIRQSIEARIIDRHALETHHLILYILLFNRCHLTFYRDNGQQKCHYKEKTELACSW